MLDRAIHEDRLKEVSEVSASPACEHSILYIFPYKRFLIISLAVILTVWYRVGPSNVDVRESANPNGNIRGIQPVRAWHQYGEKKGVRRIQPTNCIFKCKTTTMHFVLLNLSPTEVVNGAGRVDLVGAESEVDD